jgi:purine-binding chemotaxis protein CheW
MSETTASATKSGDVLQLSTFYLGNSLCGMDIRIVQEINKLTEFTWVPQAPDYVRGVLNLRGRIVTVVDMAAKIGMEQTQITPETRNVIVVSKGEYIGLLVDSIGDVVRTEGARLDPPPANIGGIQGKYFEGVLKLDTGLVGVLGVDRILSEDGEREKQA